jgi:hypothetical protein
MQFDLAAQTPHHRRTDPRNERARSPIRTGPGTGLRFSCCCFHSERSGTAASVPSQTNWKLLRYESSPEAPRATGARVERHPSARCSLSPRPQNRAGTYTSAHHWRAWSSFPSDHADANLVSNGNHDGQAVAARQTGRQWPPLSHATPTTRWRCAAPPGCCCRCRSASPSAAPRDEQSICSFELRSICCGVVRRSGDGDRNTPVGGGGRWTTYLAMAFAPSLGARQISIDLELRRRLSELRRGLSEDSEDYQPDSHGFRDRASHQSA